MKTVNLRIDHINEQHVKCTLFCDGVNNGNLTLSHEEYSFMYQIIEEGCQQLRIENASNPQKFIYWKYGQKYKAIMVYAKE